MIIRAARPSDAHQIARVHVDSWRTTYPGIVPDEYLIRLDYEKRADIWHNILTEHSDKTSVFVAEDDSKIINGFASGGAEREGIDGYDGELFAIYLFAHWQHRGAGRQLVIHVAQSLLERGFTSMLAWVLADNPACGFYQKLGGTYVTEKEITLGETALTEIAYGWPELHLFIEAEGKHGYHT